MRHVATWREMTLLTWAHPLYGAFTLCRFSDWPETVLQQHIVAVCILQDVSQAQKWILVLCIT